MSKLLDYATPIPKEYRYEQMLRRIKKKKKKQQEETSSLLPSIKPKAKKTTHSLLQYVQYSTLDDLKDIDDNKSIVHFVEDKITNNNHTTKALIGDKEIDVDNENSLLQKKRRREDQHDCIFYCMICNWKYPDEMIEKERQLHVNKCLDGKGREDKLNYLMSKATVIIDSQVSDSKSDYWYCPMCSKSLLTNIEDNHLQICAMKIIHAKNFDEK